MQPSSQQTSACRHCRFYSPQGRRGGHCDRLSVPVSGHWQACSLALPPFTPVWELTEVVSFPGKNRTPAQPQPAPVTVAVTPQASRD